MRWDTRVVHEGQDPDPATGAVNTPIYLSSTFQQEAPGKSRGFVYSRTGNPTRAALEKALASLEGGAGALSFASGLAATSALFMSFPAGARIVAGNDLYAGALRLLTIARTHGVRVDLVDAADTAALTETIETSPSPDLVFVETPSNPLLRIVDLGKAVRAAHRAGTTICVDNTFASPVLQHPLGLGADIVLHSTTKYISGHSDIIGGALVFLRRELRDRMQWFQNTGGGVPSPFDCYLQLRGIRTLALRMRAHCQNARAVAEFLEDHPRIDRVYYPGLRSHPGYSVARRQMDDFGGMVTAELKDGLAGVRRFTRRLRVFTLAESLGGVESLVNHPARMTHASIPREEREARGITDGVLRFSVGIEDPADLVEDLGQAFQRKG
ncbi:MAG: PLP-dependent aspartate aminotransferase family protein [Thermoplasmata archaeon]